MTGQKVPKGYKQTEVGVIPEDWQPTNLGSFVMLQRGHDLTHRDRMRGDVPVMGSAGQNGFHDTALVKGPGIVVGRSGASFGQAHYCEQDFWPHNTALYVTDFLGNDRRYAFYLLRSLDFSRHNTGGAQQSLNRNFIAPIPIAVPPIEEQKLIARALSDIDALIEALEGTIGKKRHIKQGAMQELLCPYFNGILKNNWSSKKLGELAFITKLAGFEYTNYFNSYNNGGEIIVIRGTNITHNRLSLSDVKNIPAATSNKLPRSKLFKDDLVFAYVGTIGPIWIVDENEKYHLGPNTCKIRAEDLILPEYLHMYFTSSLIEKEILESISTGAQPSLSMTKIRGFQIYYPTTIEEQQAIATILSDMDTEIATLEAKLTKTRQLKQGMMHELLTGRIRLV
jgi:type I restriction enzyme, S subunit